MARSHLAAEVLGIPIANTRQGKIASNTGMGARETSGSYYDGSRPESPASDNALFSMVPDRIPVPARKPVFTQAELYLMREWWLALSRL